MQTLSSYLCATPKWPAALVVLLAAAYYTWFVNPLPSDDTIVAHFRAHRADIETLVRSYRDWKPVPGEHVIWDRKPETMQLLQRAGVWYVGNQGPFWFEDPYSIEGAKRFEALLTAGNGGDSYFRRWGTIGIRLRGDQYFRSSTVRYPKGAGLYKEIVYFPVVPRIENGKLWRPMVSSGRMDKDRVLHSLDDFPPDWQVGECVLRPLEPPQWFIQMCRAY